MKGQLLDIARTFEHSVASVRPSAGPAEHESRRATINAMPLSATKLLTKAIDSFTVRNYSAANTTLDYLSKLLTGRALLGQGYAATVYLEDPATVLKVYRGTARPLGDKEWSRYIDALALERNSTTALFRSIFGDDTIAAQQFERGNHPFGKYQVLLGRQIYNDGIGLKLCTPNTTDINYGGISTYCETNDSGKTSLLTFVESSNRTADTMKALPDVNGPGNLLVGTGGNLVVIDVEPIQHQEYPGVYSLIRRQLDGVAHFVDRL